MTYLIKHREYCDSIEPVYKEYPFDGYIGKKENPKPKDPKDEKKTLTSRLEY